MRDMKLVHDVTFGTAGREWVESSYSLYQSLLFVLAEFFIVCVVHCCYILLPYQAASSSIQPFGHNRHGPKIGWGGCAHFSGGSWVHIEHNVA